MMEIVQEKIELIKQKFPSPSHTIEQEQEDDLIYLGQFRITFYCGCSACNGEWTCSPTAFGVYPSANYTCACGSDISFGTHLYIEGMGEYVCQDRGVGNGCIDIYVENHSDIPSWGTTYKNVYQIR